MNIEKLNLTGSRPLDPTSLSDKDRALLDRFPADYQDFVRSINGGQLEGSDWFFPTNIPPPSNAPYNTAVAGVSELWPFAGVINERIEHVDSEFLPTNVYAIGCTANDCLICLSLDAHNYGTVYYWDYRWQHPWLKPTFVARIEETKERFGDVDAILDDPNHPQFVEVGDALNYATLTRIAGSFSEFIDALWEEEEELLS